MKSVSGSLAKFEKAFPNLSVKQRISLLFGIAYCNYSPISRGKGLIQRNLISANIPQGNVSLIDFVGNVLVTAPRGAIGRSLIQNGEFEREEIQHIAAILNAEGGVLIDIGANVGAIACAVAKMVASSRIYAVEPFLPSFESLKLNIANNKLEDSVIAIQVGVGPPGRITEMAVGSDPAMTMKTKGNLSGGLLPAMRRQMGHQPGRVQFKLKSLDQLWTEWGSPNVSFIKIDVDGGDFEVLVSAGTLISKNRPWVLIEVIEPTIIEELVNWSHIQGYLLIRPAHFSPWNCLLAPLQTPKVT